MSAQVYHHNSTEHHNTHQLLEWSCHSCCPQLSSAVVTQHHTQSCSIVSQQPTQHQHPQDVQGCAHVLHPPSHDHCNKIFFHIPSALFFMWCGKIKLANLQIFQSWCFVLCHIWFLVTWQQMHSLRYFISCYLPAWHSINCNWYWEFNLIFLFLVTAIIIKIVQYHLYLCATGFN